MPTGTVGCKNTLNTMPTIFVGTTNTNPMAKQKSRQRTPATQPVASNPASPAAKPTQPEETIKAIGSSAPNYSVERTLQNLPQWAAMLSIGFIVAAMLWPIIRYAQVVWQYALNIPLQDDFDAGLEFIDKYAFQPHTFSEKLKLIFSQHNEHRIVLDRLAFITDYNLTGQLNFRELMFFGNLAIPCLFAVLLAISFRQEKGVRRWFFWLPLAFLLFQLVYWELTIWGMASIQNFYVLVFVCASLAALYQAPSRPLWFGVALLMAVVATYTSSNGLLVFFAGAIGLTITKRYRQLAIWAVVGLLAISLYLWGYTRPGHHPPLLGTLLTAPDQFMAYLFTLMGNSVSETPEGAARAGKWLMAALVSALAYTLYKRQLVSMLPVWSIIGFLVATSLLITAGRAGFGVEQALSSRYTILSVVMLCSLYILLVELVNSARLKVGVALVGLLASAGLYIKTHKQGMDGIENLTNYLKMNTALYHENPQNLILVWGDPAKAKMIYENALAKKTYQIPPITLASLSSDPKPFDGSKLQPSADLLFDAKPYITANYIVFYQSWALLNQLDSDLSTTQVIAQSPQGSYSFDVLKHLRYDLASQNPLALHTGFSASIAKKTLKQGRYQLWLGIRNKGVEAYQPLNIAVDI